MFGDDEQELHALAASIGLKRAWFQKHPKLDHYDLTRSKRARAVKEGAIEVTLQFVADIVNRPAETYLALWEHQHAPRVG
jgi:hypothetical protein